MQELLQARLGAYASEEDDKHQPEIINLIDDDSDQGSSRRTDRKKRKVTRVVELKEVPRDKGRPSERNRERDGKGDKREERGKEARSRDKLPREPDRGRDSVRTREER